MKEIIWVTPLDPLKDINMEIFIVHLVEYNWGKKTELNWGLHMDLHID